jgi:hypothetical protein
MAIPERASPHPKFWALGFGLWALGFGLWILVIHKLPISAAIA